MAREINSQHDQRVSATPDESGDFFTDQHGRLYHAEVEITTGHPCSPLMPVGWKAPLDVPQNYLTVLRGRRSRGAARENYDLRVEYATWIRDWTESGKRWDADATKTAIRLLGAGWDRKAFPPEVMLEMGPRPGGKLPAVVAASQGHPYVLGLREYDPTKKTDVQLRTILEPVAIAEGMNWLAEEEPAPVAVTKSAPAPGRRPGRPSNAERAARVTEEQWANAKE